LENLIKSGIRIFRINGAYFHFSEYQKLMSDLNILFKKINTKPTVLFDLKGPIPRISKFGTSNSKKAHIELKKNQIVKIMYENPKIEEEDIIQIDKKITQFIKVGDKILIDSSNCILQVISIDRYRRRNSISKSSANLSNKSFFKVPSTQDDDIYNSECEDEFRTNSTFPLFNFLNNPSLPPIEEREEDESEGYNKVNANPYINKEDKLKQLQKNMKSIYEKIVKKHKIYNDSNKINLLSHFSSKNASVASGSCKVLN
jgi:hypothetical protein